MSKYIIDTDQFEKLFETKAVAVLGIGDNLAVPEEGEKTVWTRMLNVADLEELTSDYINEHFGDLQDTAYKKGFEDGKAVNNKGCEGCKYANVAGTHEPCVRCSNSYDNQWMARDGKIEVGDEVKSLSDSGVEIEGLLPWVVTTVDQGDYCQGIDSKGEVHATKKVRACKTGRHFDIEKILEAMKHD